MKVTDDLYDEIWNRVDPELRERAVNHIREELHPESLEEVREAVEKHGRHEWPHNPPFSALIRDEDGELQLPFHFSGGMAVRNLLREVVKDSELPPFDEWYGEGTDVRNWDDYYVQALVEAACGHSE